MKQDDIKKCLNYFQTNANKDFRSLGFGADNSNVIFGIIIEMKNMIVSVEEENTITLHKHMGLAANYVANYCTINNLKLSEIISSSSHLDLTVSTDEYELEDYLEQIKNDLSFVMDMKEEDKKLFVKKCWCSIFPDDYHDIFQNIERILKHNIESNKIKNPKFFTNN